MKILKNQKQASVTKERLAELKKAKIEFIENEKKIGKDAFDLNMNSLESLIEELQEQINIYEAITNNEMQSLSNLEFNDIPEVLIASRLAQKKSQKDLANILGINEQQIQRYEMKGYEQASWVRIMEV